MQPQQDIELIGIFAGVVMVTLLAMISMLRSIDIQIKTYKFDKFRVINYKFEIIDRIASFLAPGPLLILFGPFDILYSTTEIILVISISLSAVGLGENIPAALLSVSLLVILFLLPILTITEYTAIREAGIRPVSIIFHNLYSCFITVQAALVSFVFKRLSILAISFDVEYGFILYVFILLIIEAVSLSIFFTMLKSEIKETRSN